MLNKLIQLTGSATRSVVDLSTKVAVKSIPTIARASREFKKGWKAKDARYTSIVMPKAKPDTTGDVLSCNICEGPYIDGQCQTYKCWR
jgi:hypothetical protein